MRPIIISPFNIEALPAIQFLGGTHLVRCPSVTPLPNQLQLFTLLWLSKKSSHPSTTVREHRRRVPISQINPEGITIVDRHRHRRRLRGTDLDPAEISATYKCYDQTGITYPTKNKLASKYKTADNFDEVIAIWTDYFNKKFSSNQPLDPDVVKALISSESDFIPDPIGNRKIAVGIAQITKATLKILQDPSGEAKEFIFKEIRQKDLKDPTISIPIAIRWLHRKKETAASKLKRTPTHEEMILEYKGLLNSDSEYKKSGLRKYREAYGTLKK